MAPLVEDDLPILVNDALSSKYPFYLGYNFFEPFGHKGWHGASPYRNKMGVNFLSTITG